MYLKKRLLPKIYKQLLKLNNKKINMILKQAKDYNSHLTKDDIQMANKHMKRCLALHVIRKLQIKTTVRYHCTPIQFSSVTQSCPTLHDPMDCSTPGFSVLYHLPELKLMTIESMMPSNHRILWHLLLLLPSIFPIIRVSSNESTLRIRWTKYWSLSFTISPSTEQSGLISFRIDWLDLLAVQGTLKSLFQHHISKTLVLWHSTFFGLP